MLVAKRAAKLVQGIGLHQSHFEGDSEIGIKALQKSDECFSSFGHVIKDTLSYDSSPFGVSLSHIVKQGNFIAYS